MSGQDEAQEKSYEPSPSRLMKARRDGEIAISPDTHAAAIYLAMFLSFLIFGASAAIGFADAAIGYLARPDEIAALLLKRGDATIAFFFLGAAALPFLPFFVAPLIGLFVSMAGQNALLIAPKRLKVQLSRLSPIANAKKKYGPNGLFEFMKTATKLMLILIITSVVVYGRFSELPVFAHIDPAGGVVAMRNWIILMIGLFTLSAVIVAAIDLPWQNYQHIKKHRMSHKELQEETKQNEGDPHLKQARKERAKAYSQNRMMEAVPTADVVVVNPTHYAVALKWARDAGEAPRCVAKGVDKIAARIREIAAEEGVPIRSDPPTARSIHALVEVGDEINAEHYAAVAAAIHFAEEIRRKAKESYGR